MVQFIKPAPILSPYIERYWIWDKDSKEEIYMPVIPPGLGLDLFLHHKTPFSTAQKGKLTSSHIIYSGEDPCAILPMTTVGFIAIRFRVGMFKNFTDIPPIEWLNTFLDITTIWKGEGKILMDQLGDVDDLDDRVRMIETFLIGQLLNYKKEPNEWGLVIKELFYNQDEQRLVRLSRIQNCSYRHFRRKFIAETGFTPKHFQRLARFRSALKPLLINKERKYLSTALDKGYFDQAHFIKEFKSFTGHTPKAFLQEKNFMSHFYYSSW